MIDPKKEPKKKQPKIIQITTTHDGRIASVLFDDGRVFLYTYTADPFGTSTGAGFWSELNYPDTKVAKE